MQVTETLTDGLKRGFDITLPAASLEEKRAAKLKEIGRQVRLPGFRPGKVPATIVRQRFGGAVMAEVLEESVSDATRQLLDERGLRVAGQPKVDLKPVEAEQDLQFSLEVELLPEIAMPDFAAVTLTRYKAEPAEEAIEGAIRAIGERNGEREEVTEPRGARQGDTLIVDFEGRTADGVAFPGGTGSDMPVTLGRPGFISGFAEGMEGMKVGEQRSIEVTFPAEYHAADLAGKPATFSVTLKRLEQPRPVAFDDGFAERLGFGSFAELRDTVARTIQRQYDEVSRMRLKRDLLDALTKLVDFPVPPSLVEREFEQIWARVQEDLKAGRADDEDRGKDEETLRADYRAIAERRVRLGLLLAEIGRTNQIQVQPDEMTRAMRAEAGRYPGQEAQVMEFFRKNPQAAEGLRGPIFEDKVVDFILELAKVEDRTVPAEELSAEPREAATAS